MTKTQVTQDLKKRPKVVAVAFKRKTLKAVGPKPQPKKVGFCIRLVE